MTVPCAFPLKPLFCNKCRRRSGLNFTCLSWDNLYASWRLLYVRPSFSRHCSRYCKSVYALLPALALPTNRLTHLLASAELSLLRYAHDTSSIAAIAGVFHPCAFRRNIWARSLVLCGTLLATRNSNNVRSSDSVKTIRMGAGIRKIVSLQKTHIFYLTFYCSRLLSLRQDLLNQKAKVNQKRERAGELEL